MAINLQDIRIAVQTYLTTKVSCSVSVIAPDVPTTLNPNEGFTFSVSAANANVASGGIRLKNVKYCIFSTATNIAKLIVPPATVGTAYSAPHFPFPSLKLNPGVEVSGYYLVPPEGDLKALEPGETDTVSNLKGKAGAVGAGQIRFWVEADVDLEYVFPRHMSSIVNRGVNVV